VKSHLPSLGKNAKDLKVSLSFDGQTWTALLGKKGAEIAGPDSRPRARILRRSMILDVVDAQPKERYEALQGFIAVPGVQKCETALRDAAKAVVADLSEAIRASQQAKESLETLWKAEGGPGKGYWLWAKDQAAKDPTALGAEVKAADRILKQLTACAQARTSLAAAETDHKAAKELLKKAEENFDKAQARLTGIGGSLIDVLKDAETYLKEKTDARDCPVCERPIDAKQLQKRIADRLAEIKEVVELRSNVDDAIDHAKQTWVVIFTEQKALVVPAKKLAVLAKESALAEITALSIDWSRFPCLLDPKSELTEPAVVEEARALLAIVEACQSPLEERHASSSKTLNQLNAIQGHVKAVEEKTKDAIDLDALSKRLSAMLDIVEQARKDYVTGILAAISGTVEELYLKVHPEEGIGGIRFYLKPNVQGSLEFDGKFQGATEVPPQAYYSESHLDTLGVCIFLALARHFHDGNTVVVLDDVVTSADHAHVGRFMNMLHDEAVRYNQLILTTHYRPWRERYRFARGPAANIQLIELLQWSLPRGIRSTKTKLAVEELREVLAEEPLDRQSVSSKAGILMESLLDHLALLYGCRLPRRAEPEYTLGDLAGCIGGKLRRALKVQRMSEEAKADEEPQVEAETALDRLLTAVFSINWIRNQVGCHWSEPGLEVSDTEVKEFAGLTIRFAEALVCEHCGEVPRVEREGAYHQCGCGRTRLHPCNNPD
jgi:hypothetical protein